MATGLAQSYPLYQRLGLASVGHECLSHSQLAATIFLVRVRWLFYDSEGNLLTDGTDNYVLRRDEDGLHAYVCIPVDEAEKLQQLAADRGIDLSAR
ncbi:hypothetical protein [Antrihabitans cavernicola]|uniref:Uncharacterized protein n=1 Tax=Antrihabitans cavernicola TaxID=2495913 RepID=A0A5A7SC11_9NOCA|nr:hypothetical protein [Spelaeibacter cavernicola]KAA0022692.1 hypothetical protein FOY51_13500 [Spelaeibacter cavernicola]